MKVGLALGGGGAKGFFHIGVLKALEKLKIRINSVAGTSMGALIGGLYALRPDAGYVEKVIFEVFNKYHKNVFALKNFSDLKSADGKIIFSQKYLGLLKEFYLWNARILKPYIISSRPFYKIFREIFGDALFSDCRISFVATAVDINSAEPVLFKKGFLYKAVLASSAVPGVFSPVKWGENTFIDGGVLAPVPVSAIKGRNTFVIASNIENVTHDNSRKKSALDILTMADKIRYRKIVKDSVIAADFVIYPFLEGILWSDFDRAKELVKVGETEVLSKGPDLIKRLRKARLKKFFF
ncbi:MAG: patatin-like phospholipase family protein [Candidatus Omnitrophota bacterium]|nr:MAG: patatin-like phospholipase family protein [Candidatus Omnitrophota bacterium]